jgi:hypothetical protein
LDWNRLDFIGKKRLKKKKKKKGKKKGNGQFFARFPFAIELL